MRKLTADSIYTLSSEPLFNSVVVFDNSNKVLDIINREEAGEEVEMLEGVLFPGFVNAHCHLELSHLHGEIKEKTGIVGFANELISKREKVSKEAIVQAMQEADKEMTKNGIVAVGDISNDDSSFKVKAGSTIKYFTFIELLALDPERAKRVLEDGKKIYEQLQNAYGMDHPPGMLSPHAPYTVSGKLLSGMNKFNRHGLPISIHNQESKDEAEFFMQGTGTIRQLYDGLGIDISFFQPSGKNSLASVLNYLPTDSKLQLVHNTFADKQDVQMAHQYSKWIYWCLCPSANLYIENTLPDVKMLMDAGAKITIGTDSLASNYKLSVLDELKVIAKHYPKIPLQILLTWACKNGAEMLGFETELGSIEKGKRPGINLLKGPDIEQQKLSEGTKIYKII